MARLPMRALQLGRPLGRRGMADGAGTKYNPFAYADSANNIRKTRRSPDPTPRPHIPETEAYVLTFHTDKPHRRRMTQLRTKYFPRHLNKLEAHLTIFHALPGSRLDSDIIPVIEQVARSTAPFKITASQPLNKRSAIIINTPPEQGGARAKEIRDELQAPWRRKGFLTPQDAGETRDLFPHYTIMNKVWDETEVDRAMDELERDFTPDEGRVLGLALYLYDRGWWRWVRNFKFENMEGGGGSWGRSIVLDKDRDTEKPT